MPNNAGKVCEISEGHDDQHAARLPAQERRAVWRARRLDRYYDLFQERDGTTMIFVTAVVQDPVYLDSRYIVISHFKKEPDGSKWDPTPCSARW